jgi:hypothetical protein
MKKTILIILIYTGLAAETIYDGYDSFYKTYSNTIFKEAAQNFEWRKNNDNDLSFWKGTIDKKYYEVKISNGHIVLNKYRLDVNKAIVFPNEQVDTSELVGDKLYISANYACIEAVNPAANGQWARHKSIYLINFDQLKQKKQSLYLLPSLFGSCSGIRLLENKKIAFDKISYINDSSNDLPIGVTFNEYYIDEDKFVQTQQSKIAHFPNPENVYRFELKTTECKK